MSNKKKIKNSPKFPFDIANVFESSYFGQLPVWQQEIISFYNRRMHSYYKIPEHLAQCRDLLDIFDLQSKFFTKLINDYQDEAAVIFNLLVEEARFVENKIQKLTEADYDEAILKAEKDAEHLISLAKNQAETIIESAEARAASIINKPKRSKKVA